MQRAFSGEKVRTHDCKRDHGAGRRGKPCAEHAKVQHEHAEPVAKHIENAAGQHCRRGKPRSCVVSQEACHKLPQQEHREHAADRRKIRLRQRQKRFVRAEKQQDLALKKKNPSPRQHGENAGADDGGGKILIVLALPMSASTAGTEQNTPADAGQKPQ